MPNLALMDQLIPLLEGAKGISLEQWQKMLPFWQIFINSDFDNLDGADLKRVCKSRIVPDNLEVFELGVAGTVRKHTLVSYECSNLNELILQITNEGLFRAPYRSALPAFARRFPKSDGNGPICSPIGTAEGRYESIEGNKRERWLLYYDKNSVKEKIARDARWLVEVVDEKLKQPEETGWKEVVLKSDIATYKMADALHYYRIEKDSLVLRTQTLIKIGPPVVMGRKGEQKTFVPYKFGAFDGFILACDVESL
jgi:hypothetical protein